MTRNGYITRFAPSPTGFLHIGGARTALFNYLLAQANSGQMKLRIEDTDKQRSTKEAIDVIIDGLKWLGIKHNGDIVFQSDNSDRHIEVANQLLANGKAYEKDGAIRLRVPNGYTEINDKVQGTVKIANKDIEDFVLLRSDGSPIYMLAAVVDDHDMGITHVVRGDDHLTNAAKQILIYNAMNWQVPTMAHLPLIHGDDGKKLSKRDSADKVERYKIGNYKDAGYLPKAVCNYLLRLGWSHGDQEIFSMDELKKVFGFSGMRKAPSQFDLKKLDNVNKHYIKNADSNYLLALVKDIMPIDKNKEDTILRAIDGLKTKSATVNDIKDGLQFLLDDEFVTKEENILSENKNLFAEYSRAIKNVHKWQADSISQTTHDFLNAKNMKFGELAKPLRAALTNDGTKLDMPYVIFALGKQEVQKRLAAV